MDYRELKIDIYADGADIEKMKEALNSGFVKGFTTNPTLMKKAGVKDYKTFAKQAVEAIRTLPLSFEVFSDDHDTMEKEARVLSSFGENVYVKIPVTNTKGEHSTELIRKLSHDGLKLNVTAVFTKEQAEEVLGALDPKVPSIVSIFAGRITNAGVDAEPVMREVSKLCRDHGNSKLLWASSRELFNVIQAERSGADIITLTDDLIRALPTLGKDLYEYSLDTVKMFYNDGQALGYRIL
ncbi:MAG: transaldolase [Lachnospiraceae bacterium]|nr:transaldolase [Lachnospiraceae bacterium]